MLIPAVRVAYRWTFYIGVDGTILRVDRDVSPKTAGADIARTLADLAVPRKKPKSP